MPRGLRQPFTFIAAAIGGLLAGVCAEKVLVAQLVDDIVASDLSPGGNCEDGCTREVHAIAHVSGSPQSRSCELQTVTPFDSSPVQAGLLRASVYCEDSTGALIEEGTGPCQFNVCVDFRYIAGEGDDEGNLEYDVVIVRSRKPRAPHTVYVDLSVAVDPTSAGAEVDSCEKVGWCAVKECTEPEAFMAKIVLTDEYGDGWVGGASGIYNIWTLSEVGADVAITRGTLANNHFSAEVRECLADGKYIFNATANAAFADEIGWQICDVYGKAGEGVEFTVSGGVCTDTKMIERATAEETSDAEFSYCTLPAPENEDDYRTSTCTSLSSGLKIDGVALYYDDRCNSADYSGCGARSIDGCRICFVDKEQWLARFPDARVPDWEMCPCCVAAVLGVECATSSGGGGTDKGAVIGVSVGIVGVIAIACCLSCAFGTTIVRFFRRLRRKKGPSLNDMDMDVTGAAAFPDSPTNGGTMNGHVHTGHRNRGHSGHFPIPRFDSVRGRFDSGIFASNNTGTYPSNAIIGGVAVGDDVKNEEAIATAQSTPSGTGARSSPSAPRSTVLDGRLATKGFTTSDVGRPGSSSVVTDGRVGRKSTNWGLAMSGEYPDLDEADPYAGDNLMADTGTAPLYRNPSLE